MDEPSPKVRITYQRSAECRTVPVSGAWGGISPSGYVVMGLYIDTLAEPTVVIRDQDTRSETPETERDMIEATRMIQTLALMSPEVARKIGDWLKEIADKAEAAIRSAK